MGVWIGDGPVVVIDGDNLGEFGEAVLKLLGESHEGIPHPTSWKGSFDKMLKAAGVKSWRIFVKSAKCVEIEFSTNRVGFLPTKNGGAKDGYGHLSGKAIDCAPTQNELLKSLLAAFAACE